MLFFVVVFKIRGVSLTHPVLGYIIFGEFFLHIPCWIHFYLGNFSYTFHAGFIFVWGVSGTHSMLACFFNLGIFSYTSRAGFIFIWGISLKYPVLASIFCGEFLLHIRCWLCFYIRNLSGEFLLDIQCWLPFFLSGEFLLHILCWLHFICGVSLTDPAFFFLFFFFCTGNLSCTSHCGFFLCGEFHFYLGSFSYKSRAASFNFIRGLSYISHPGFIFIWGVSGTDPMLPPFCLPELCLTHPVLP